MQNNYAGNIRKPALMVLSLAVFFLFVSCGKKWKETTVSSFEFSINKAQTNNGHVHFVSGSMQLSQIRFIGTRKRGDDVNFTSTNTTSLDFSNGTVNPPVTFDIPQGTYTNIQMEFRADPADTASASIRLVGQFVHGPNDTIPVYFEFDPSQVFTVQAETADGNHEITLVKDQPVTVQVTFDPVYWFDLVTYGQLQAANHVNVNNVPSIVIDAINNSGIYQSVAGRIRESTKVVFQ